MTASANTDESRNRKPRWLRFSLRTLLVVMLLLAVAFGWFGMKLRKAQRQREAVVVAIQRVGGSVAYDYGDAYEAALEHADGTGPDPEVPYPARLREWLGEDFFFDVQVVYLHYTSASDDALVHLRPLSQLEVLELANSNVQGPGLEHIEHLTNLWSLSLNSTGVTDDDLLHLSELDRLEQLHLSHTAITDVGLAHLSGLVNLEILDLGDTQISDRGLAHIRQLRNLERLTLSGTQVTDAGLEQLCNLPALKSLDLNRTTVTGKGLSILKKLPNLQLLTIDDRQLTPATVDHLNAGPQLTQLNIVGQKITDEQLKHLTRLTNVPRSSIRFKGQVSPTMINVLRQALPTTHIGK